MPGSRTIPSSWCCGSSGPLPGRDQEPGNPCEVRRPEFSCPTSSCQSCLGLAPGGRRRCALFGAKQPNQLGGYHRSTSHRFATILLRHPGEHFPSVFRVGFLPHSLSLPALRRPGEAGSLLPPSAALNRSRPLVAALSRAGKFPGKPVYWKTSLWFTSWSASPITSVRRRLIFALGRHPSNRNLMPPSR
jgi:hypothetical protein